MEIVPRKNGGTDEKPVVAEAPEQTWPAAVYRPRYSAQCIPDAEWQRGYLEQLRYKWRYKDCAGLFMATRRSYAQRGWAYYIGWTLLAASYLGFVKHMGAW